MAPCDSTNVIGRPATGKVVTILSHLGTRLHAWVASLVPGVIHRNVYRMPRKAPGSRNSEAEEADASPRSAKAVAEPRLGGPDDLARLALKACLIARDAAFNVRGRFATKRGPPSLRT